MISALRAALRRKDRLGLLRGAWRVARQRGLAGVYREYRKFVAFNVSYTKWCLLHDTLDDGDREAIARHIGSFSFRPLISILVPTFNTPERWLRQAIDSVRAQLYATWELCIADDASSAPHVRRVLEEYGRLDARIRVTWRPQTGHISAATNSALAIAHGDFVALLDHDDELPAHALYMVVASLNDKPDLDLIYSDEDKIDQNNRRFDPYFKPDWNPDLLLAQNLVSHLSVYRAKVLRSVGGFRSGVEGSQDWDVALRVAELIPASRIRHIPHVLYHWRAVAGSTAVRHEEKSYVVEASMRVVREHLERTRQSASVERAFGSFVRTRFTCPTPPPLVSVILIGSSMDPAELVRRSRHQIHEILPCCPPKGGRIAEAMNEAATRAQGQLLCFLDVGLMPDAADWLDELVCQASRAGSGAVGPMHLDVEGNLQGGFSFLRDDSNDERLSWAYYRGAKPGEKGVAGRAALAQNVSILAPGCLVIRTATFRQLNGFDSENFPEGLSHFDLCLRLTEAGYRNLWTPHARLASTLSRESILAQYGQDEARRFRKRWRGLLDHDPAHNPNLRCNGEWPLPAFPTRADRPWRPEHWP